jgi:POT family proton-dependent oligopeptide transporter
MSDAEQPASGRGWLGYPRGAWLIISVEFWERFSFYGMLAILALFLTATPARGGFGWPPSQALGLLGIYSGAMYAFPAFGGYLADRVIGRRRAVAIGASIMLVGQVLMVIAASGAAHGALQGVAAHSTMQGVAAHSAGTFGFYSALVCLIVGNALMKSTLVVLCGETFTPGDPRREGAYAYYYLGISVGAMLSGAIIGVVSESYGWHYGFATAAIGMAAALGLYLVLSPRWLRDIGSRSAPNPSSAPAIGVASGSSDIAVRLGLVFAAAVLLCLFSFGWFQLFGSWSLFIERSVDRSIGSFVIPVPWFSSINAAVVIAAAPFVAALWMRLPARGKSVDIVRKYTFALSMAAIANFLMYMSALSAGHGSQAGLWAPVLSVAILGIGEIVAWTATYGFVTRAAPAGLASMTMGAWYLLTLGLGGYLSGFAGLWIDSKGFAWTFGGVAAAMAASTVGALLVRGPFVRIATRAAVEI